MSEIDFASYDLNSPRGRQAALMKIPADRGKVKMLHGGLRDIFRREMDFRKTRDRTDADGRSNYFESIYHCALLLYLVGDPADVPLMWAAKHIDMDTGCGFDGEFLVGAGVAETIKYHEATGNKEIADYIKESKIGLELNGLQEWEHFRINYFYPE
jgi:hypothetical protein